MLNKRSPPENWNRFCGIKSRDLSLGLPRSSETAFQQKTRVCPGRCVQLALSPSATEVHPISPRKSQIAMPHVTMDHARHLISLGTFSVIMPIFSLP
jgi:hypothetical protein